MASRATESGYLRVGRTVIAVATGMRVLVVVLLVVQLLLVGRTAGIVERISIVVVLGLVAVGAAIGYRAWTHVRERRYARGGTVAMLAAFVPPLDLLFLIGSVLVLRSDEAHGGQGPSPVRADEQAA